MYVRNLKPPAWENLELKDIQFYELTGKDSAELLNFLGREGKIYKTLPEKNNSNFYRYISENNAQDLFIKLEKKQRDGDIKISEETAIWLSKNGINAVYCIDGYPREYKNNLMLAYKYIDGRFIQATESDLTTLGKSIAFLHNKLSEIPSKKIIKKETNARLDNLQRIREDISKGNCVCGPSPLKLKELSKDNSISFTKNYTEAQPLHGDLNPGNMIMMDSNVFFLDFEDTIHSFLCPFYELAYVIERIILVSTLEKKEKIRISKTFLNSYLTSRSKLKLKKHNDMLLNILRGLSLRSLCTLALYEINNVEINTNEWKKFFYLEELARNNRDLLQEVVKGL